MLKPFHQRCKQHELPRQGGGNRRAMPIRWHLYVRTRWELTAYLLTAAKPEHQHQLGPDNPLTWYKRGSKAAHTRDPAFPHASLFLASQRLFSLCSCFSM